jgi:hypothetical protein
MPKFMREPKEATTETSVEPRLKKGVPPTIQKTGAMGMPRAARPNVAPPLMATPAMKKGGKVHEDEAQDRAMIKKAMAGKKFKTGGVANAQGGYKTGGVANAQGGYKTGGMIKPAKYKEGGHVAMKGDSCGHTVMKKKYGGSC